MFKVEQKVTNSFSIKRSSILLNCKLCSYGECIIVSTSATIIEFEQEFPCFRRKRTLMQGTVESYSQYFFNLP